MSFNDVVSKYESETEKIRRQGQNEIPRYALYGDVLVKVQGRN